MTIDPHPVFTRSGLDLRLTVPVTFTEAALGATVAVPTFDTPLSINVPPGTQGGTVLAVEGRGVRTADGTTGRLVITLNIGVPTDLVESDRGSLESLTGTFGPELRSILFERDAGVSRRSGRSPPQRLRHLVDPSVGEIDERLLTVDGRETVDDAWKISGHFDQIAALVEDRAEPSAAGPVELPEKRIVDPVRDQDRDLCVGPWRRVAREAGG